jgi:hypothetical protein
MQKYPDAGVTSADTVQQATDKIKASKSYQDVQAQTAANLAHTKAETAASLASAAASRASAAKSYADMSNADISSAQSWVTNIKNGSAKFSDVPKNLKNAVSTGLAATGNSQKDLLATTATSLKEINDMVTNNNGFTSAVGAKGLSSFFGLKKEPIAGTAAADFDAKLAQVKNDVILPNLAILHGLGRVTDREFQSLTSAVTSLSRDTSEAQFKSDLADINKQIDTKLKEANAGATSSAAPSTPPPAGKIWITRNGQTGSISPSEFDPKTDVKL